MSSPSLSRPGAGAVTADDQAAIARGLTFLLAAIMLLPGQDTIAKYLATDLSPGQITWARFLFQVLFTLPFLVWMQGWRGLVPNRIGANVLRGVLLAAASALYFTSLRFMQLADAVAIVFIQPFILTILSAVIDKEEVGWRRRIAVAAGFVGVLVVVQPSWLVFGPASLIPAAAGVCFAFYMLLNRRMTRFDTPLTMQFTAGVSGLVVLTLLLALGGLADVAELSPLPPVGLRELGFLLLMGVFGTSGHLLFVHAGKHTPSSLLAPLQYVEIVFAVIFGYFVFDDFPSPVKWLGIGIVVGSGAYIFWRESRRR